MGTWAGRFAAYINKDVVNPNESKKTAVMTRWLCTVMMLYAIGQKLFMLFSGYYASVVFPIGFFCIYGGAFRLTYSSVFSGDTLDTVRKLMDYNREITYQAETDALTGLRNRRAGEKYFEEIRKEAIQEGFFVNVVMGDIDFFKKVNDTYGHDAGDEVLKVLAGIFQDFIKDKGAVARWGGEEFLFVMVGMNGDEACFELEKLCERIEKTPIQAGDQELYVTMTFGIEECGREKKKKKKMEAADRKLYMGKAKGRNQVVM